jgi:uncharacterized cupin superfamily protein
MGADEGIRPATGSGRHRYVVDGEIVLIDDQGNREEYVAGEGVVLPRDRIGTSSVPEGGRKIWVSYERGKR